MFTSIVVALDLEREGDRALPIVNSLSAVGDVSVELLTVESPGATEEIDAFELRCRATANGWSADSYTILHDDDPARAIVEHVHQQPGALLVMSTTAKSPLKRFFLGSVSEAVLSRIHTPVLLIGPHVAGSTVLSRPTLVACVDSTDAANGVVPVVAEWTQTFDSAEPTMVEIIFPASGESGRVVTRAVDCAAQVRRLAARLATAGVVASWHVLHGADIGDRVEEFANGVTDAVLVAISTNWTDDRTHWHSTTRRLVQHSRHPVLVIPARRHAPRQDDDHPGRPTTSRR